MQEQFNFLTAFAAAPLNALLNCIKVNTFNVECHASKALKGEQNKSIYLWCEQFALHLNMFIHFKYVQGLVWLHLRGSWAVFIV